VYTWRYLIEAYPKSSDAERARRALARMPNSALAQPMPPPGTGYAPTTAPSADVR
jgi:hypothetical protein